MSSAALAPPGRRYGSERERKTAPSLFDALGGEPTLDELLSGVWEGLAAHRNVRCPVCGGQLKPVYGAQARAIGGRCDSCRAALS